MPQPHHYPNPAELKDFLKKHFPFEEIAATGLFDKKIKTNYVAQARKICDLLGLSNVFEYEPNTLQPKPKQAAKPFKEPFRR